MQDRQRRFSGKHTFEAVVPRLLDEEHQVQREEEEIGGTPALP